MKPMANIDYFGIIMNLKLKAEMNKNSHYWGRIEDKGNFTPTGQGETVEAMIQNVKDSIEDYQNHEGKEDPYWNKLDLNAIQIEVIFE